MPVTPFHFGLGIAAKAAVPRWFSLSLFVALQVAIDLESLYNLHYERYPVHRFLHTFVGAGLLALATALVVTLAMKPRTFKHFGWWLVLSLFATWSHVVLDGIMHRDAQPFWPLTDANPLLRLVGLGVLHAGLAALGFFGGMVLLLQYGLANGE